MNIPKYSIDDLSINSPSNKEPRTIKPAPFFKQLVIMLKISFLQRVRAPTITLEIILPIMFLIFECLFASRFNPYTDTVKKPEPEPIVPFSAITGPSPNYGMIPNDEFSHEFIDVLNSKSYLPIKSDVKYFDTFEEYKNFIFSEREVNDTFYCTELNSDKSNYSVRISSNGMTYGSLPYLVQDIGSSLMNLSLPKEPIISLNYKKFPHASVYKSDRDNALYLAIFSTVHPLVCLMTTGTYYGNEAESGLRDFFTFFGLSFFVNEMRWYIVNIVILIIISIPFSVALAAFIKINFGLIFVFYLLNSSAFTSFLLCGMSLWPTKQMASIISYFILFSLFICIFWGFFDWLYKDSGFAQKYVLSIFPNVAIAFSLCQIGSGEVTKFNEINGPSCCPVKTGFIYLATETVVYFCLYILIEAIKKRLWLPAPINWGKPLDLNKIENDGNEYEIISEHVTKEYKDVIALKDISFDVKRGETLAIVGPNGAGKSTLMSLLSGTLNLDKGRIFFKGIDIMRNTKVIHQVVGLCPQKNLFMEELTVDEWLKTICVLRNDPEFDYTDIIMSLGLDTQRKSRIGKMSGGNKRKTCLAAALICHPPIVILDEATSGVDFTSRSRIWSIISGLNETTVIMATHTLEECEKIADRIMVIVDGQIINLETPNNLRQIFNCGYVIITDEENLEEFQKAANDAGIINPDLKVEDGKVKLLISYQDSHSLVSILQNIHFKYILSIQSLEETIFNNIQTKESKQLYKSEYEEDDDRSVSGSDILTVIHPKV